MIRTRTDRQVHATPRANATDKIPDLGVRAEEEVT